MVGAGDMAAMEASMGRGRGRSVSNLPAWMTKGAVAGATPAASTDDVMPVRRGEARGGATHMWSTLVCSPIHLSVNVKNKIEVLLHRIHYNSRQQV